MSRTKGGFTLLELTIAMGIGMVVLGMVANAYLGANKAQSTTVATGLMKASGQTALNNIYTDLHQAHTLFDRNTAAETYLNRLPIQGYDTNAGALSPGADPADIRLPQITANVDFISTGAPVKAAVGNCLFFLTTDSRATLGAVSPFPEYMITAYRMHFYFLARRPMAAGSRLIRPGENFTYQLMHWESEPYLDYNEVVAWMNRAMDQDSTQTGYIDAKLSSLQTSSPGFAGAIDPTNYDGSTSAARAAVYDLTADGARRNLVPNTIDRFETSRYHTAIKFGMRDSFGETMVAFNTQAPAWQVPVAVPGLTVPAFGDESTGLPYGFEVMIGGDARYRQVMLRLSLAARTHPGSRWLGQTFQQVVQTYGTTLPGAPLPTPAATPTPTPVPSSGGGC